MTATLPPPPDVRLMNAAANALFAVLVLMLLAAGGWWLLRNPVFSISRITVMGEVAHNSAPTLRANVAPRLAGNFFTVDLAQARHAFENAPWVRQAVVHREFPNRLRVTLQEHHAVALWGSESEPRLLNNFGEVFEANVDDVDQDDLPRLAGPDGQSAQVLAMYLSLKPLFEPLDLALQVLELTAQGNWRATLDNGAVVQLGHGDAQEVGARTQRFIETITQAASRYGRRPDALQSADLRYARGYAIRLRGVATTDAGKQ